MRLLVMCGSRLPAMWGSSATAPRTPLVLRLIDVCQYWLVPFAHGGAGRGHEVVVEAVREADSDRNVQRIEQSALPSGELAEHQLSAVEHEREVRIWA